MPSLSFFNRALNAHRRAMVAGVAASAAVGATALPGTASAAPNLVSGATYELRPAHTTAPPMLLEVLGRSSSPGTSIIQNVRATSGTGEEQRFVIRQAGTTSSGRPYFRVRPSYNSNLCLDANSDGRVRTGTCTPGVRSQQLYFDSVNGSVVHMITVRGTGQVLDVAGASEFAGAPLIQFGSNGQPNQRFVLTRVA